jgi:hypothetical protein
MSIINGLFGNKAVLNLVLSSIKTRMTADGISAIMITQKDIVLENDHSPGLDVRSFKGALLILTGEDAELYKKYRYAIQHEYDVDQERERLEHKNKFTDAF